LFSYYIDKVEKFFGAKEYIVRALYSLGSLATGGCFIRLLMGSNQINVPVYYEDRNKSRLTPIQHFIDFLNYHMNNGHCIELKQSANTYFVIGIWHLLQNVSHIV